MARSTERKGGDKRDKESWRSQIGKDFHLLFISHKKNQEAFVFCFTNKSQLKKKLCLDWLNSHVVATSLCCCYVALCHVVFVLLLLLLFHTELSWEQLLRLSDRQGNFSCLFPCLLVSLFFSELDRFVCFFATMVHSTEQLLRLSENQGNSG